MGRKKAQKLKLWKRSYCKNRTNPIKKLYWFLRIELAYDSPTVILWILITPPRLRYVQEDVKDWFKCGNWKIFLTFIY